MQYIEIFKVVKKTSFDIFLSFAQIIDCEYSLEPPRSFGAKIKKLGIPLQSPIFFYRNMGFKGVYLTWTCFPDDSLIISVWMLSS